MDLTKSDTFTIKTGEHLILNNSSKPKKGYPFRACSGGGVYIKKNKVMSTKAREEKLAELIEELDALVEEAERARGPPEYPFEWSSPEEVAAPTADMELS